MTGWPGGSSRWCSPRPMDLAQVGLLAAIYPATWGVAQLVTGACPIALGESRSSCGACGSRRLASSW